MTVVGVADIIIAGCIVIEFVDDRILAHIHHVCADTIVDIAVTTAVIITDMIMMIIVIMIVALMVQNSID